mgnify:CR=1 FL=1
MIVCAAMAPEAALVLVIVFSALLVAGIAASAACRTILDRRAARRGATAGGESAAESVEKTDESVGSEKRIDEISATGGESAAESVGSEERIDEISATDVESAAESVEKTDESVGASAYARASGKTTFDGAAAELPPDQRERLQKLLDHALSIENANRKDVGAKLKVRLRTKPLVTLAIRKGAIVATFKAVTDEMDEYRRKTGVIVPDVVVRVRDDESLYSAIKMTDNTALGYKRIKEAAHRRRLEERRAKRREQAQRSSDPANKN